VAPDGSSRRLCYGLLNLCHREGHDRPSPMPIGKWADVSIPLGMLGEAVLAGHRLRLALSTSYWPIAWPSPEPVRLRLAMGTSRLILPVRPPAASDAQLRSFPEPESTPAALATTLQEGDSSSTVTHDLATGGRRVHLHYDYGAERIEPHGLETTEVSTETLAIREGEPNSAEARAESRIGLSRGDWNVRIETRMRLTSDTTRFRLEARLDAFEGTSRVFARDWVASIPRDHL
jgi:uncharacterized protein